MEDIIDIIVTETTNLIEITSQATDEVIDVNIIDNREDITLNVTPTVVEININSLTGNFGVNWGEITGTLSNQTDLNTTLGLKADLVGGKVPSSQLPSYVDDVVEVANYAALPATGETGKIYITLDTNYIYRWTGSTYVEIKDSSAVWGAITGTLSSQTDLQSALNAKEPTISPGTTAQYWRGDKSWQTLNTTAVTEGTNLYYTDARARAAVSAGTGISYSSSTGVIASTITQYTDALARAAISLTTSGSSGSSTYSSTTGVLNVPTYTLSGLGGQTQLNGTGFVKASGTTISYDNNTYALDSAVVKLAGSQTITGQKTFSSTLYGTSGVFSGQISATSGNINGDNTTNALYITHNSSFNSLVIVQSGGGAAIYADGKIIANQFIKIGGASTSFLKADGSVDNNTYLTTSSASSTYLPLIGGTLTGALSGTTATFSGAINLTGTANSFQVASIFRNANRVFFGGDTGGYFFQNSANSATLLQIADSGAATFSSSVATSAIKFPSTQNADSDPNTLDDYEEGTFTPTLTGSGSNPTVSYTSSTGGIYTKVGNKVSISFEVRWSSLSGGSGLAYISGLPFTRRGSVSPDADHLIVDSYNNIISGLYLIGNVRGGGTSIALNMVRSNNTTLGLNLSDLGTSGTTFLRGSVTYFV